MANKSHETDRRTLLKATSGAVATTTGLSVLSRRASADQAFSPPDLVVSDYIDFYVVREDDANYRSEWDNHIDNWGNALEDLLENHLGVSATIAVHNEYDQTTIEWNDPSDWPSKYKSDPNTVSCMILEDEDKPLGYSYNDHSPPSDEILPSHWNYYGDAHEGSFHVNQTAGPHDMVQTPERYIEPMLMHELIHILSPGSSNDMGEHSMGNVNAEYHYGAGMWLYEPTAMATGYVLCNLLSSNSPQGDDCDNNTWLQTCNPGKISPQAKLTDCSVTSVYYGIYKQSEYKSSYSW